MVTRVRLEAVSAALVALGVLACSSSTTINNGATCGAGTHLANGACVADDAGADSGGDTPAACPTDAKVLLDCSGTCIPKGAQCAINSCATANAFALPPIFTSADQLPAVLRTPDHPGTDPKCLADCAAGDTVWVFGFHYKLPADSKKAVWMTVDPPWHFTFNFETHCTYSKVGSSKYPPQQCIPGLADDDAFFVYTTDPAAPARNVRLELIDLASPPTTCP